MRRKSFDRRESGDAPWLVVPLLLGLVLALGLALIFGWSVR